MRLNKRIMVFFSIFPGYLFTFFKVGSSLYNFSEAITFFLDELDFMRETGEWYKNDSVNYIILQLHRKIPERIATEVAKFPSETATNFF